jgi:hypothetical protein
VSEGAGRGADVTITPLYGLWGGIRRTVHLWLVGSVTPDTAGWAWNPEIAGR